MCGAGTHGLDPFAGQGAPGVWAGARCSGSCSTGSPISASTSSWSRPARSIVTTRWPTSRATRAGPSCADRSPMCSTGSSPRSPRIRPITSIRLTADCPLADPVLIEAVLARHLDRGADYTSNVFPRTFPARPRLRGHDRGRAAHRARRSDRPGRARARDAVSLPAARAVRARQHAQRRTARP